MEPEIRVGSLAYAARTDPKSFREDDIVVYRVNGETLTRRIISADSQARTVTLRGDSRPESEKRTVSYDDIKGKISFVIPGLGKLGLFANTVAGKVLFLGMMFAGARMIFYADDSDEKKKPKPPEGKKIFTAPED